MCTPSRRLLSRTFKFASSAGAIAAVLALAGTALTQESPKKDEVFKATTAFGLNNTGLGNLPNGSTTFFSFDISWVDPALNKYFLADRSNKSIDILDLSTSPPTLKQVVNTKFQGFTGNNDTSGPDGVLTANNHTEVWVGDTGGTCFPNPNPKCGPGQVWVLNTDASVKTLPGGVTNPISVGGTSRADELCYAPEANVIMIASPSENYVSFISTKTYKVLSQLIFNGSKGPQGTSAIGVPLNGAGIKATNGLEQCQFSEKTGKFYQNVPEVNGPGDDTAPGAVAVIDPTTMKVETSFPVPLDACAGPQGMTIGPHNQILLGCAAPSPNGHSNLAIINQHSGAVLASIPDLGGADEVWFNDGDGHYFVPGCNAACRANPGSQKEQLGVIDANGFRLDQSVSIPANAGTTGRRVHSVAADAVKNQVFVPIPAITGTFSTPSVCSTATHKVGSPTDATGCIAVFTTTNDDRSRIAHERDPDDKQE